MFNRLAGLSVNLWDSQAQTTEGLVARIREVAPLAQLTTVETSGGGGALWISFESVHTGAFDSVTELLQGEFNANVYSFRRYQA